MQTDLKYARGVSAPGRAKSGMRQVRYYLGQKNIQKFYDTLFDTLQEYLGNRFHLPSKGITISVIDEHLSREGVSEEILAKLRDIFRDCDMARYASVQLTGEHMQDSLKKLEEIIDYFQRKKYA